MKVIVVLTNAKVVIKNMINVYCSGNFDLFVCAFLSLVYQTSQVFSLICIIQPKIGLMVYCTKVM